jgi:hypothetical protein
VKSDVWRRGAALVRQGFYLLEMFASDLLVPSEVLVKHHQDSSEDREECAETKDNNVSNSYTQGPVEVSREDEKTKCWCWRKAPKTQPGYN